MIGYKSIQIQHRGVFVTMAKHRDYIRSTSTLFCSHGQDIEFCEICASHIAEIDRIESDAALKESGVLLFRRSSDAKSKIN